MEQGAFGAFGAVLNQTFYITKEKLFKKVKIVLGMFDLSQTHQPQKPPSQTILLHV